MTYFVPPDIKTDVITLDAPQRVPEPTANALQKSMHKYVAVPGTDSIEYQPGFILPDIAINYGWSMPQVQNWYQPDFYPLQSPGIQYASNTIPAAWNEAKAPTPTTGKTGVRGNMRSPGINEGL